MVSMTGGFDKRLKENVEYLEEIKNLAEREGVLNRIRFITSCSTAERNALLLECLCVLYTPKVCETLYFLKTAWSQMTKVEFYMKLFNAG